MTERDIELPAHKAPHEALQDALFVYAVGYDGMGADLIRGWPALVERVVDEVAGDDWEGALCDLDEWLTDGDGVPFRYSVNFEDGFMAIYRVHDARAAVLADRLRASEAEGNRVYLVATGEFSSGYETYTRHENNPPLCDSEVLYTHPASASEAAGWQPIETAPKDGTNILGYREGFSRVSVWWFFNNRWNCDASYHTAPLKPPTHWMPLPSSPTLGTEGETR